VCEQLPDFSLLTHYDPDSYLVRIGTYLSGAYLHLYSVEKIVREEASMARVVCLSDSVSLVRAVREEIAAWGHTLYPFPCSRLNDALRQAVRQASPDVILLELTGATDNPHIYFFLRADQFTRNVPVIFLSASPDLAMFAEALGANGSLRIPFERAMLRRMLGNYLDMPRVVDTPRIEVPRSTIQRYASLLQRPQLMTVAAPAW